MSDKKTPLEAFSALAALGLAWVIAIIVLLSLLERVWLWLVVLTAIGVAAWLGIRLLLVRRDRW